jgi:hypothetical protein
MEAEKVHSEADQAVLDENRHKMIGIAPLLEEMARPKKTRLIFYDGFLLLENNAINLRNVSIVKIKNIMRILHYGTRQVEIHTGYKIIFEFEKENTFTYKEYELSFAVLNNIKEYLHGCSAEYPIDTEQFLKEPRKQLKAVVNYEMEMLFNTINR